MINWLHISDLHLGSEGTITNMMRDELPIYLKRLGVKCERTSESRMCSNR